MQFTIEQSQKTCDPTFANRVKEISRAGLERCYQCHTCTLSCPVAFAMDYLPNQIIRMVQMGLKEQVLSSSTIWLCAACETCVARCPNDVDVRRVMDTLREMELGEKVEGKEKLIPIFHRTFLDSIKQWGRTHELSMLIMLKLKTRKMALDELTLGLKMFLKGKLKPFPKKTKGAKEIKGIFERTKGEER
jgi:heterodisulfide reductase subunit C